MTAAPTVLPIRSKPAAARPALPPRPTSSGVGLAVATSNPERWSRMISVAFARSLGVHLLHLAPRRSSSTSTSSSELPSQLAGLRLVEPTRAHRPSATAVFAWSIVPFHSKTRTPASSKVR